MNTLEHLLSDFSLEVLANAEQLWPDPFEAPETPPRAVLLRYLAEPEALPSDLRRQIEADVNCARALELLDRRSSTKARKASPEPRLVEAREASPATVSETPSTTLVRLPLPGQIWTVRSEGLLASGNHFYNFDPVDVILRDRITTERGHILFEAFACSPMEIWPDELVAEEDDIIDDAEGEPWCLHRWLPARISIEDLERCIAEATPPSERARNPPEALNDDIPAPLARWRERLQHRARTLSWTAEALESNAPNVHFPNAREHSPLQEISALKATADAGIKRTGLLRFRGGEPELQRRLRAGSALGLEPLESASLQVQDFHADPDGTANAVLNWTVFDLPPDITPEFLVFTRDTTTFLGLARLSASGGYVTLEGCPWTGVADYTDRPEDLIVITLG